MKIFPKYLICNKCGASEIYENMSMTLPIMFNHTLYQGWGSKKCEILIIKFDHIF